MRITTDRRPDRLSGQPPGRPDPFDRLTRAAARLPGAYRVRQVLQRRNTARRWIWFLTIYVVSVTVFGAVALALNAIVPK